VAVETADDLAAFFDVDEWGETATYTPAGGQPATVTIVRARAHALAELGAVGVNLPDETAYARASEIASPAPGDTLAIGNESYRIERADQDALAAVWTLHLARTGS